MIKILGFVFIFYSFHCSAQRMQIHDLFVLIQKSKRVADSLIETRGYKLVDARDKANQSSLFWGGPGDDIWFKNGEQVAFEFRGSSTTDAVYYYWNRKDDRIEDAGIILEGKDSLKVGPEVIACGLYPIKNPSLVKDELYTNADRNLVLFSINVHNDYFTIFLVRDSSSMYSNFSMFLAKNNKKRKK